MNSVSTSPLFKKLYLGTHQEFAVFNAPDSFEAELKRLKGVKIARDPSKPKGVKFGLAFAVTQAQLDRASKILAAASEGDAVIWFAYPKEVPSATPANSTAIQVECHPSSRLRSVRMVAIDEDWSALRFRRLEYVKPSPSSAGKR